ncbi:hypothetical protein [Azospirillum rugosum]|uniref:Antifreeze glycopeptide polyprotein n=1 Tax=Azospirillum rugosum TaxID=416170 RepID=A0ABS4SIG3_9PROT|nr:hypothetical protein [Azospirillum rugosum]MBP2292265.1 hypothetical protein [Azospirillum rugosum]MDQ0526024.1 hypothetical protein [Azospirillum rugosum]
MSGSPADAGITAGRPRRPAAFTVVAAGAFAVSTAFSIAAPALAQDSRVGPPIRLVPVLPPAAPPAAVPPPPVTLVEPPAPQPPSFDVVPKVAPPAAIQVETLGPLDPDGAGTLDGARGLGGNPWQGLPRAVLLRLLPELPVATPSPAVKELQRRLLLSRGSPQAAPGEPAPPRRFGALRVEKLAAMGDPRGAADLASLLPEVLADEGAARALTDAQMLAGPLDCAAAQERAKPFAGAYWQRVELFCRLRAGKAAEASDAGLALDMLREQPGGDRLFPALAEAMAGGPPPALRGLPGLKDPGPVTLAALRALQFGAPPDVLALTDPARLAAVATSPATDPATRVTAAERAAAALFLDARQLADAYHAVPSKGPSNSEDPVQLKDMAARDRSARTRALVQRAFLAAMDGRRRVELARLAVDLVDAPLLAGPLGAAAAGMLDTVSPTPDAAALAPAAARLYFALGRADAGRRWHDLALRGRPTAEVARLWPLSVIASGAPAGNMGLAGWMDEALRGADAAARARVAGQLALLQAVGVTVPDDAWLRAADGEAPAAQMTPMLPNPALWERLKDASAAGRTGETVLAALLLLGEGGPAAASPVVVARVVAGLRAVGLEADARAVAREAAAALAG